MKSKLRPLILLICLMITTFSVAQTNDENTGLIRNVFDAYFDDFVARDFEGMASHYQAPLMIIPARVIDSREDIVDFLDSCLYRKDMPTVRKTRLLFIE
jgi:hypothetical protein